MRRYRIYGLTLASEFPFTHPLPSPRSADPGPASASVDLLFELTLSGRLPGERRPGEPAPGAEVVYRSPERLAGGENVLTAVRSGRSTILDFADAGCFAVGPDRIVARPEGSLDARRRAVLELRLLGPVLAFWLECSGRAALHAAAVTVAGRAAVFLSSSHGGKTSLAAALMTLGRPLLTDDVLAIEETETVDAFRGHPGYPQMRLWPADVERFVPRPRPDRDPDLDPNLDPDRGGRFPRVHPGFDKVRVPVGPDGLGTFDAECRPPGCIYLPGRLPGPAPAGAAPRGGRGLEITRVPPRQAVLALVRHSFLPRLVAAMGWQERRLDLLARLASRVPVRRLTYPSGHEHLPAVARAVLDDLKRF